MKDSNTSTPSKCKTEMTPGWQNHRQGERVNLCLSLLRTHGRPLLQNFQIWSNAAYTLINHFHFDSVFNEQKRTRQCFCMNYIDNGPYGCGICADPTNVTHMRINPTYAEYADDAHRQISVRPNILNAGGSRISNITFRCVMKAMRVSLHIFISLYFSAFLCISLHFSSFLCMSLHFSAFHGITLHFSTFLCISLNFFAFLCISLHFMF